MELERKGVLRLPPVRSKKTGTNRAEQRGTVCQTKLCASLQEVSPVVVEPMKPEERADWNATMAAHHPLGFTRAIGAHQRYWIRVQSADDVQVVGALLFGAAAKALSVRDEWIGWTPEQRRRFRSRIVNNNRYLILPEVRIPHLASHALALAAHRIRPDWQVRYGYEPVLLETFVEPHYAGTCYAAANWIQIGHTAGRGRHDRAHRYETSEKSIWMYPLVRNWRKRLFEPLPTWTDPSDGWEE
ncbi:MAG: DUF4338 domain-containing protein [Sulfobacillus thermotolerans]|nr:DUF4338 domain-containing protein [Sulfobacillus thermotolerans]